MKTAEDRFWAKVNKRKLLGCWEWTAGTTSKGYGVFWPEIKKPELAHRLSWILKHGSIPEGIHVLHKCDNPICVRPLHLFLGTQKDNLQDASRKGRISRGTDRWNAKLTEAKVREMRRKAGEIPIAILAKNNGITWAAAQSVVLGKTWRHV